MDTAIVQMCKSIKGPISMSVPSTSDPDKSYTLTCLFSELLWPTCSCPAYQYSKPTVQFGAFMVRPLCKHIKQAQDSACSWHAQWAIDVKQSDEQMAKMICPRCGGPTVYVRVKV